MIPKSSEMKQIKAKNEVKKAKTKGKQEGEEVMKKRNWVIMMSAAALAMASVTGCSSQNGGETTAKAENAGGSKDGASADGVKEITMWYQENKTMIPAFDQRVEDFNKEYEGKYHLTIEYIPRGSSYAYEDKVNSAAAAGILPDLLSLDGPNVSN